jgi:hypothetical protein
MVLAYFSARGAGTDDRPLHQRTDAATSMPAQYALYRCGYTVAELANPPLGRTATAADLAAARSAHVHADYAGGRTAPDIAGRDIDMPVRRRRCETCPVPEGSVMVDGEGCTWPACHA